MGTSADKKAEFRKYLDDSGVMDAIVKSLVLLYQEPTRPEDPIVFVANKLGGSVEGGSGVSCAEKDEKISELTHTVEDLKSKLGSHEPPPAAAAPPEAEHPAEPAADHVEDAASAEEEKPAE